MNRRTFFAAAMLSSMLAAPVAAQEKIKTVTEGTLTISISSSMPNTGFVDSSHIDGLDGDIITNIANTLGLKLSVTSSDWTGALAAAQTCRSDAVVGPVGWTTARAKTGLFTDPTYYTPALMIQREGSAIDSIETMAGKKIGIPQGYLLVPTLKKIPNVEVQVYPQVSSIYDDLAAGRIDGGIIDTLVQIYVAKTRPELKLTNMPIKPPTDAQLKDNPGLQDLLPAVNTYLVCKKEPELEKAMTKVLNDMRDNGKMLELLKKWGGDETYMKAFPFMTTMRVGVDRPEGWTSPSK
jgi:ABC-type amino acid transport substrate-binding protein